ncbi:hypothetical protein DHEL01_v204509 [Diaporthe helianthi]|uniref:Uncharacterized protein n=1 Tax=Diaporthe helianthi TaxID=158607 RepID=A0A2P5I3N4_DIAHE|nr:hypothetical protein DHEL01_v204509 [Diaporthe helianthi]
MRSDVRDGSIRGKWNPPRQDILPLFVRLDFWDHRAFARFPYTKHPRPHSTASPYARIHGPEHLRLLVDHEPVNVDEGSPESEAVLRPGFQGLELGLGLGASGVSCEDVEAVLGGGRRGDPALPTGMPPVPPMMSWVVPATLFKVLSQVAASISEHSRL